SSPSEFLAGCLERYDQREPEIGAFCALTRDDAIAAAKDADVRWAEGRALSPVDGMPIGVKDIIETRDMPTGQGSPFWEGTQTHRDAASVQALRSAGAVILGKTTTTEYAALTAFHQTRNPHDPNRTPGGSSSGSAAAVGAGIIPAALGTQVVGSILRPASYCGCVGFKPSVGALNRSGSFDHLSQSCTGVLAASPQDAWIVASAIAGRVGGDPGFRGLDGPAHPPATRKPERLALLQTGGWEMVSSGAKAALTDVADRLRASGIDVSDRGVDGEIDSFEQACADAFTLTMTIFDWEYRWPWSAYTEGQTGQLSPAMQERQRNAAEMTLGDYRSALARRSDVRMRFAELMTRFDACILLSATGAAPMGFASTGDPGVTVLGSLLGGPAISVPLLSDDRLPLGLQLIGRMDEDEALTSVALWAWAALGPSAEC
ncbi:MAG: amidase, partial [Pseudomonadota bacterium]